jgi:uncharacterized protein YndB with AHSA1/START domain
MVTTAITSNQDAVTAEVFIAAPPERVFQAVTDRGQVQTWGGNKDYLLTAWEMELRPGGRWLSITKEVASGCEFAHYGEIVELAPPHLLAYTWFANFHEDPAKPSLVRWEFTATAGGTTIKVTHSGLATEPKAREAYRGGWPGVLEALKQFAER